MYFYLILLTLILTLTCRVVKGVNESFYNNTDELPAKISPPKLNLIGDIHEIRASESFEVECFGNRPLEWRIFHANGDIESRINITESVDYDNKGFQFSSKLVLTDAQYTDTSRYGCFYNGTDTERKDPGSIPPDMAWFYLYVNDDDHLMIVPDFISGVTFQRLVIPCRPTNPKIKVTLWLKTGSEKLPIPLEEDRVWFEPTKGFVMNYPLYAGTKIFVCDAYLDESRNKSYDIAAFFTPHVKDLPEPIILDDRAKFVSVSQTLKLRCEVEIDDVNVLAGIEWKYPASHEGNSTGRIFGLKIEKETRGMGMEALWSSELEIRDVKMSDMGDYTCVFVVARDKKSESTLFVRIHENEIEPFINLKARQVVRVQPNTYVKMVFEINTTISLSNLDFHLTKDGNVIMAGKKYNVTDSTITPHMHQKILSFHNATREDSGNYTLVTMSGDIKDTASINLYVRGPPLPTILNHTKFFMVGKSYQIKCVVDGYPSSSIWFERRRCDPCSPKEEWQKFNDTNLTDNNESLSEVDRSVLYRPHRVLSVTAMESAEYSCVGNNTLGMKRDTMKFMVSDVEDGFKIIKLPKKPIEGDNVTLSCMANKIFYSNISFYTLYSDGKRYPLPLDSTVTLSETEYSYYLKLNFPKIKGNFGKTFQCVAKDNAGSETTENYSILVENAVKPRIMSNGSRKFELKHMDKAVLSCAATGVPIPEVIWYKDGKPFKNTTVVETISQGKYLRINVAIKKTVEGTYKCLVRNRAGNETREFQVFVEEEISVVTISLAVILPILLIALLIACFCCIRHIHLERREKAELEALSRELFNKGEVHLINPDIPLDDQVELLPYDHKWEFPKDRLKLGRILGQGAFGRVVKAKAIGLDEEGTSTVAVKMLKERADKTQRKALMAELKILIHLRKHLNVVNLLGAVTTNMKKGELLVIVEYCRYGNLRNYLLKRKHHFINQLDPETGQIDPNLTVLPGSPLKAQLAANQGLSNPIYGQQKVNYADLLHSENSNSDNSYDVTNALPNSPNANSSFKGATFRWLSMNEDDEMIQPITTCDLLCYAFQVARGMQHLSESKLLHRDLAARNVLLADNNIVKICDFGLAKDCYKCDNYKIQGNGPLPIKWMALESLEDRVFTTKSDVWSYGILLWEFFTLGGDPYPGMDLDEDFYKRLKSGYRMEKPDYAPNNVYRIMLQCWDEIPDNRPNFELLGDTFGDFLEAGVKDFYLELDTQYAEMNALNKGTDYLAMSKSDYLSMGTAEPAQKQDLHYDNVASIRPIDDGPVTSEPMEVIPMIQLEPVVVNSKRSKGRPAPETPPVQDTRRETDYLLMGGSNNGGGEKSVFSRQRKGNESLRSDASSGFHSDLDTSSETNPPPSYNMVMEEETVSIEV